MAECPSLKSKADISISDTPRFYDFILKISKVDKKAILSRIFHEVKYFDNDSLDFDNDSLDFVNDSLYIYREMTIVEIIERSQYKNNLRICSLLGRKIDRDIEFDIEIVDFIQKIDSSLESLRNSRLQKKGSKNTRIKL